MLASERQALIYNLIRRDGSAETTELKAMLKVSEMTIRRDIDELEARRMVQRVRGGAIAIDSSMVEVPFAVQAGVNLDKKLSIAHKVIELVSDGMNIAVDGSSTGFESARLLKGFKDITLVTNNISVLWEFRDMSAIHVVTLGGSVAVDGNSIDGAWAQDNASQIFPDIFIFSCVGFNAEEITTTSPVGAEVRKILLKNSQKNVLLADSTKFGKKGFIKLFDWKGVDVLVTNSDLSDQARDSIISNAPHLEILLAESDEFDTSL